MFETGLAVGRSLGRAGVRVLGLDSVKKIGFYSKYIDCTICPHPVEREGEFIAFLLELAKNQEQKPVLFITSDEFLIAVSRNRRSIESRYLLSIPEPNIIESITDKLKQYELCVKPGVAPPKTFFPPTSPDIHQIKTN